MKARSIEETETLTARTAGTTRRRRTCQQTGHLRRSRCLTRRRMITRSLEVNQA